jgi:outer membrane protein TolC
MRWANTKTTAARATLAAVVLLSGCATFSKDGGFSAVETVAKERLQKDVVWARDENTQATIASRVGELLKQPLSVDDAVQIAILNNRGLQATFAELGIAEAEFVQAGRLPNPGISYGRLKREHELEVERGLHFNLARLVTLPWASRLEGRRFERTKATVAAEMLAVAAQTRNAYFQALAAQEATRYLEQVRLAAEAAAELSARMARTGNLSKLDHAREQVFYAEATARLARAKQAAVAEREKLIRLMGLWGNDTQFKLPERLPDLPSAPKDLPDVERTMLAQRLDIQMAQRELEGMARSLGLTKATRFVNVFEVGILSNSESHEPRQTGYEISLELPIFDFGGARVARAEAMYMQALHRTQQVAVNARSEAREAYSAYRTAYDLAKHYRDEIVPLRKRIGEENVLRYNGMLISVFELLADAREQVMSVNNYIEALRDYWLAESNLDLALTGKSPGDMGVSREAAGPVAASGGGH